MIAKKKLNEWLTVFIRGMCELSGSTFTIAVNMNRGVLRVPSDIFEILKTRRVVIELASGSFVFKFRAVEPWTGAFNVTFQNGELDVCSVHVIADPQLKTGLILTVPDAEK